MTKEEKLGLLTRLINDNPEIEFIQLENLVRFYISRKEYDELINKLYESGSVKKEFSRLKAKYRNEEDG